MTERNDSAGIFPLVSRAQQGAALAKALRTFVGRGKMHSYKTVQRGAGVPSRMLECYMHQPDHEDWRQIKPEELASLCSFLGPDFTTEWLSRIADQGAYWLPDGDDMPPGDLALETVEDSASLSRVARSGDLGENDRQTLKVVGARMVNRGQRIVQMSLAA